MKGIYKGFKYITHIFVMKEEEIQIGLPTDVKHVAHIGLDGPSGSAPSWMNEFKVAPEFSSSLGSSPISEPAKSSHHASSLSSQDASLGALDSEQTRDAPPNDTIPKPRKKHRRKKHKYVSSPKVSSSPVSQPTKSKLNKTNEGGDQKTSSNE